MKLTKQQLRRIIKEELRLVTEARMWGVAGAGVLMICHDDRTCFLQKRSGRVTGGASEWSYISGGIPIYGDDRVRHINTNSLPKEWIPAEEDPIYKETAIEEWGEETGQPFLGDIKEKIISSQIKLWKFHLFIATCSLEQKNKMLGDKSDSWESESSGWVSIDDILTGKAKVWKVAFGEKVMNILSKYSS